MSDGFPVLDSVTAPFLERVVREEPLGREHPRRNRDENAEPHRKAAEDQAQQVPDDGEATDSMSSLHIDLRI
jgi:hypothetical protein